MPNSASTAGGAFCHTPSTQNSSPGGNSGVGVLPLTSSVSIEDTCAEPASPTSVPLAARAYTRRSPSSLRSTWRRAGPLSDVAVRVSLPPASASRDCSWRGTGSCARGLPRPSSEIVCRRAANPPGATVGSIEYEKTASTDGGEGSDHGERSSRLTRSSMQKRPSGVLEKVCVTAPRLKGLADETRSTSGPIFEGLVDQTRPPLGGLASEEA
mmetsp:Transcript_10574/g.24498  ORF Transcript_10574/g.24498 Transcript_10574/m.24498 type:complete len:212 (-) Transcript_10574:396-1031(-)